MKRVAVVGAGISGLACALRLQDLSEQNGLDLEVAVFEASPRVGGNIRTERKDGFLLEYGPDAFLAGRPVVHELCRRLGIENRILPTREAHRRVSVIQGGRLVSLPESFYRITPSHIGSLLRTPLFSAAGKWRMASEFFIAPRRDGRDESVASFVRRRFGREALDRVGQPMIAGIYSGDPEKLSAEAVLPEFRRMERLRGGILRGMMRGSDVRDAASSSHDGLFLSFREGMATLPDAAAAQLPPGSIRLGRRVTVRRVPASDGWIVTDQTGHAETFDAVCLAVNARQASLIFNETDPALAYQFGGIRLESVATLNLAYEAGQFRRPLESSGLMAPAVEGHSFMGAVFSSLKFEGRAPEGCVLLRAFVGGAFGGRFLEMTDEVLARTVSDDLARVLRIDGEPLFRSLSRYPGSLPQYDVGHQSLVTEVDKLLSGRPGLYVTGTSYRGTGIARAIEDGQIQAERIAAALVTAVTDGWAAVCQA